MATSPSPAWRVLLVGNYRPDAQQSMLRYAEMLRDGLGALACEAELLQPPVFFGRLARHKYFAYLDKFLLFPSRLRRAIRRARRNGRKVLVHICDHSNAMYAGVCLGAPVLVTCHDLLAVRGALGEETDCPASLLGRLLQRWIVRGLSQAWCVACVSAATLQDARRLIVVPRLVRVPMGLNYPYRPLDVGEAARRLAPLRLPSLPFVLHVGSSQPRKNREAFLRIFARAAASWNGVAVFAGEPLTPALLRQAEELGIRDRVHSIADPENPVLHALYARATALLFPSRFEGFGWPIIEAQACGCPVICSDIAPLPEVAGEGAILCPLADEAAFTDALLRLTVAEERAQWARRALANAENYTNQKMLQAYVELYREMTLDG